MLLKVKSLKLSAGRPVAILNYKTASKLNLHPNERIRIKKTRNKNKGFREIIAIVDVARGLLNEDSLAVSSEIFHELKLKENERVSAEPCLRPLSVNFILKKLNGKSLSYTEIYSIISDIVNNALTEAEIAYFVSGMYENGMSLDETANLIRAMVKTGKKLKLNHFVSDKHSIGGIAGNRTTPIIVSICAAAGLIMPKTSSKAITSAAGTADVIETIAKVDLTPEEIKSVVKKTNACLAWGGSLGLAPADDKLIQVERLLSLDPKAQLIASILAKKISVGATHVLLDIPFGKSAKVNKEEAVDLAKKFHKLANLFGIKIKIALTDGSQPIGTGIGPILEMRDILAVLIREKSRPLDLEYKAIVLAGLLLELVGKTKKGEGKRLASYILNSGQAFKKFKEIIEAQHGSLHDLNKKLMLGRHKKTIKAQAIGKITEIDNKKINYVAKIAGCPVNKGAGLYLYRKVGDFVKKQDSIVTIFAETKKELDYAVEVFKKSKAITINNYKNHNHK